MPDFQAPERLFVPLQQTQADVGALVAGLHRHRHAGRAQQLRTQRILGRAFERLALRVDVNRWTAPATLERHGEREMPAFDLCAEKFAEHDFEIEERRRIGTRAAKLVDDFSSRARERSRVCTID